MAVLKCKMCGGDLEIQEGVTVAECEYCGTRQTVPTADDEKKLTLFGRANRLRLACEFDKAAGVYEAIVADFPDEAEAYWGLVLCKYGIEYVDDPATAKKIPTCHRSSFDSVMDDADFEQVMENADMAARSVYREEAKCIEELRRGIVEVSSSEEPYDIFICYKETDANGDRTVDSEIAQDVYTALTERGYRVFFARISLEDKLGQAYEPYIFAALNSAKIMLVFGTDYEYFNAVWVKNEWSRFLQLIAKGESKTLIPCYKGVDAYDIPKEFAKLQAQDIGKVGAQQDLLRGIEKILPRAVQTQTVVQQAAPASNATVDSLLKRVFLFLEDEDWESADEYCEKVLDIDPENAKAYLGKLMVELQVSKQGNLKDCDVPFDDSNNYQKAIRFANEALASMLKGYNETIVERRRECERAAEERKRANEERERVEKERKRAELAPLIKRAEKAGKWISGGSWHTVGVKADGTVATCGGDDECEHNVSDWHNIVAVAAGFSHTIGLRSDGTVVACGDNGNGECNVAGWHDIVAVAAGVSHTIGLRSDGTVVACGDDYNEDGECNISGWHDIVAVAAGASHTIGLRSDGTVVGNEVAGYILNQCKVSDWHDIVAVAVGSSHTVGLCSDGTVVACGDNEHGECNVSDWHSIVAVTARNDYTIGLRSDGTVVACGNNEDGQCDVFGWSDIVAVAAGESHTIGLRSDGTVVACGENIFGQCDVSGWRLFNHIDTVEEERAEHKYLQLQCAEQERLQRAEHERLQAEWRASGVCQHCGGAFKGMFTKKCSNCGKEKDY